MMKDDPSSLDALIKEIGIARFCGHCLSGLIDMGEGMRAVRRFVEREEDGCLRRWWKCLWRSQ